MKTYPLKPFNRSLTDEERREEGMQRGYNAAASLAIAFQGVITSEDIESPF